MTRANRTARQSFEFLAHAVLVAPLALLLLGVRVTNAQRVHGELRIEVRDPQGAALAPKAELVSDANQFRRIIHFGLDGRCVMQDIPFGIYRLSLKAEGFAPWSELVEVRSEVPVRISVTLGLAPVATQVQVSDSATLVDPSRAGTVYSIGRQTLGESLSTQPGRDLCDLVDSLPGWLYEANGVLHARGSEYDVQYVVDGLPITANDCVGGSARAGKATPAPLPDGVTDFESSDEKQRFVLQGDGGSRLLLLMKTPEGVKAWQRPLDIRACSKAVSRNAAHKKILGVQTDIASPLLGIANDSLHLKAWPPAADR